MQVRSTKYRVQSGQALVLVLLGLAVVLTLVLFILSRSVTDIAVSSRQEESVRAFSAAEAGIEQALVIGTGAGSTTIGNATFSSNVTALAEGQNFFNYPISLNSGDTATTWFVAHNADGITTCSGAKPCFKGTEVNICWGNPGTSSGTATTPAVEVSVFYEVTPGDPATARIARGVFDPNSGRTASNLFSSPDAGGCSIDGVSYTFQKNISFSALGIPAGSYSAENGLQFARIRMLYNSDQNQAVGVSVSSPLPSQGLGVVATGTAGQSNRRINVFQGWPEAPSVFDYAIYSSTGLTK